jgi:hypothetical protein
MNSTTKRIESIHSRIDKIALKGKDNYLEFSNYFNDLSTSGDYDNLLQCLYIYYNVDIEKVQSFDSLKRNSWKQILFSTNDLISTKIKKLYDKKLVYQTGFDIYRSNDNYLLGQIVEEGIYNDETKYLIKNKEYARITKTRKTFLVVKKTGATYSTIINQDNLQLSEENNLYNRYVEAVNLLLS